MDVDYFEYSIEDQLKIEELLESVEFEMLSLEVQELIKIERTVTVQRLECTFSE